MSHMHEMKKHHGADMEPAYHVTAKQLYAVLENIDTQAANAASACGADTPEQMEQQIKELSTMSYIYKELNANQIADALRNDDNAGWSNAGARVLGEHLVQMSEDIDEPIQLDIVALRCEFSELDEEDVVTKHGGDFENLEDDEKLPAVLERLEQETTVLPVESITYKADGTRVINKSWIIREF